MVALGSASALKLQQISPSAEVALAQIEESATQGKRCLCFQYKDCFPASTSGLKPDPKNGGALTLPDADGKCLETEYKVTDPTNLYFWEEGYGTSYK